MGGSPPRVLESEGSEPGPESWKGPGKVFGRDGGRLVTGPEDVNHRRRLTQSLDLSSFISEGDLPSTQYFHKGRRPCGSGDGHSNLNLWCNLLYTEVCLCVLYRLSDLPSDLPFYRCTTIRTETHHTPILTRNKCTEKKRHKRFKRGNFYMMIILVFFFHGKFFLDNI